MSPTSRWSERHLRKASGTYAETNMHVATKKACAPRADFMYSAVLYLTVSPSPTTSLSTLAPSPHKQSPCPSCPFVIADPTMSETLDQRPHLGPNKKGVFAQLQNICQGGYICSPNATRGYTSGGYHSAIIVAYEHGGYWIEDFYQAIHYKNCMPQSVSESWSISKNNRVLARYGTFVKMSERRTCAAPHGSWVAVKDDVHDSALEYLKWFVQNKAVHKTPAVASEELSPQLAD